MKHAIVKLSRAIVFALALLPAACNTPTPVIEIGKDSCWFCKMTVMDKKFGAVLMNAKGKALKFDSEECMVSYLQTDATFIADKILVADYNTGALTDAGKAYFIHGGTINSPMGGQLAAFENEAAANTFKQQTGGESKTWQAVAKTKF